MYKTIIHPTDLLDNHYDLCVKAKKIADNFSADFYLLHVIEPPAMLQFAQSIGFAEFDRPVKENALTVMKVLGESLNLPEKNLLVAVGAISENVKKYEDELGADLIIIGMHAAHHVPPFLGSTAHKIIHDAKCDVISLQP